MPAGLIFTEFTIAAADRIRFAAWHSNEHARERLGVVGVTAVERYVDVSNPLHFCCLYRATNIGVYASDEYLGLAEQASPLTREILGGVKGTRFVGETLGSAGGGQGGLMTRLRRGEWSVSDAEGCIAKFAADLERGAVSRVEVARPGSGGPPASDTDWIVLLEGATADGLAEAASHLGTEAHGEGLFRLEHAI